MTDHTPGPWIVGWTIDWDTEEIRYGINTGTVSDDEAEANARLIAAAPDMYNALLACAEYLGHQDDGSEHFDEYILPRLNKATDAINKAEGDRPMTDQVTIYDNGGESFDRYTVIYPDGDVRGMSHNPLWPQGFCLWVAQEIQLNYDAIGERIEFADAPEQVQRAINMDLDEFYNCELCHGEKVILHNPGEAGHPDPESNDVAETTCPNCNGYGYYPNEETEDDRQLA